MASTDQIEAPSACRPPRVRLGPVRFHHMLLDGSWWPSSTELGTELRALVPALDNVRGPVTRLLLSAGGWTARPYRILTNGRTVTVGYLAGQSPFLMTVFCADGGAFTMRVTPPTPGAQGGTATEWDEDVWETPAAAIELTAAQGAERPR